MDEAPSTPKLSRRSPAAASGWSAATMVRAAARVLFAIAGRTGSQRFNGAGQRRGDPGPDPLGERPLGHAPRAPGARNQPFHLPLPGSIGHCATLP